MRQTTTFSSARPDGPAVAVPGINKRGSNSNAGALRLKNYFLLLSCDNKAAEAFGTATFGNTLCAEPGNFLISYPKTATKLS